MTIEKCDDCLPQLVCIKCENIMRYNNLDISQKSLIQLYDVALENNNLELAFSTMAELTRLGIDDITTPVSI